MASCAGLAVAAAAAYLNSFKAPFVFDDLPAIVDNPTIRSLWPPGPALAPPPHATVSGRPILNLSLALNHAIGGNRVEGYHAANLAIHILAGLALFGILRRLLAARPGPDLQGVEGLLAAFAIALIWLVHPLQTESVTYVVQRAESLMGLFYLLTLYGFLRGSAPDASRLWYGFSVMACLLGMATKEVMVTAPLLVLLCDRTFVAGSFGGAWRLRRPYYIGLACTWLLLAFLMIGTHSRAGSAGFGVAVSWRDYALTQLQAIPHYLRLALWPSPLVFDYGTEFAPRGPWLLLPAAATALLGAVTGAALWRRPAVGFAGAWFLAILAPTSSVVPVATQVMAEHRMYLPLAAPIALAVLGIRALAGRPGLFAVLGLGAVLACVTARRNEDYRSAFDLWSDTVAKRPGNARAQDGLGNALDRLGRGSESIACFAEAVRLQPGDAKLHNNLASALAEQERYPEATEHYREAIRLKPAYAEARYNLANLLEDTGRLAEAIGQFEEALRIKPDFEEAEDDLAIALMRSNRGDEAIAHHERALALKPDDAAAHYNFGLTLEQMGRMRDAIVQYESVLRLDAGHAEAKARLARLRAVIPR